MLKRHRAVDAFDTVAARVEAYRARVAYQDDPVLTEAYSDDELEAERDLAELIRRLERRERRDHARTAAAATARTRRTADAIDAIRLRDDLAAAQALAAHQQAISLHGRLAGLHRYRTWAGRGLGGVVAIGMIWSAINVQHNIAPGASVTDPLYWMSYGIEAMISICLIVVMAGTPRLAAFRVTVNATHLAAAEVALLALTLALNTYPHLHAGDLFAAGAHAVAPGMIAIALLIHHAVALRVAEAMNNAAADAPAPTVRTVKAAGAPAPAATIATASPQVNAGAPQMQPAPAPTAPARPSAPAAPSAPAPVTAPPAAPAPKSAAASKSAPAPAKVRVHAGTSVQDLAAKVITARATKADLATVVAVITAADAERAAGHDPVRHTVIADQVGIHHNSVKRILKAAGQLRANARVIPLRTVAP